MSRVIPFEKIQGAGNDFVVIDARRDLDYSLGELSIAACDRHYGIGADGLIAIAESSLADYAMIFFNPDGTRDVCGNGMRCAAQFIGRFDARKHISLEVDSGIVEIEVVEPGSRYRVNMGVPRIQQSVVAEAAGEQWTLFALNTGTPHAVTFVPDVACAKVKEVGALLEHHKVFGEAVSIDFVEVVSPQAITIRIWERSVGETMACGTGACAAMVAAVLERDVSRTVHVTSPGGTLEVEWSEASGELYLTGPARQVFRGEFLWRITP